MYMDGGHPEFCFSVGDLLSWAFQLGLIRDGFFIWDNPELGSFRVGITVGFTNEKNPN